MKIRPSMLNGYTDCPRRSFVKMIDPDGKKSSTPPRNIGSVIGTAAHFGVRKAVEAKIRGEAPDVSASVDAAIENLADAFLDNTTEILFDDTTGTFAKAQEATGRALQLFHTYILPGLKPYQHDTRLEKETEGFVISGEPDLIEVDGTLHDFKFGHRPYPYYAQIGAYSLLIKSVAKIQTSAAKVNWIPRLSGKIDPPVIHSYTLSLCERLAVGVIHQVKGHHKEYEARGGDIEVVPVNPSSNLCSAKYCPAHGTVFCKYGKNNKQSEF